MNRKEILKPYNITNVGENDAEVNMYGEVVDKRPVDWWTGKPVEGNFIAVDEFLKDLEELSTKDNITVHLNSVGGSLYGGMAIYNRLKALPANIVTVNDSLAASAGSIIFMAGDTRKVNAGSNVMIHGALGFLFGYYQVKDLNAAKKQLEAGNKAAINIYAEATGKDAEHIKAMMDKETWLTGQEAVDEGFATEVISDGAVSMSLTADKKFLVANGVKMSTFGLSNIPQYIPVAAMQEPAPDNAMKPAQTAEPIENNLKGAEQMEIKNTTELRAAFPDFVKEIEDSARAAGVTEERARIQGIEAIQAAIVDADLINNAKYGDKPLTAEQLAFQAMQAQAKLGNKMLDALEGDTKASGAAGVTADPNGGAEQTPEEKAKADVTKAISMIVGDRGRKDGK